MKRPLLLIILIGFSILPVHSEQFYGYTIDNWPPFMFKEDNRITGIATEIVREVFRGADIYISVEAVPWTRAYKNALEDENTFIYLLYRTPEREELFKWVGPIVPPIKSHLYKLKEREDIRINAIEEAKEYRIGVVRGVANHNYLLNQGFEEGKNIEAVTDVQQNIGKFVLGRVDLIINTEFTLPYLLEGTGLTMDDVEIAFTTLESEPSYIGLNKSTSDDVILELEASLRLLQTWNIIEGIYDKFTE